MDETVYYSIKNRTQDNKKKHIIPSKFGIICVIVIFLYISTVTIKYLGTCEK